MSFTSLSVVVLLLATFHSTFVASYCNKYLVDQTYLGAHNAYHEITKARTASTEDVGEVYIPVFLYDYKKSIFELLKYGVRGIEIDILPRRGILPKDFSVLHIRLIDTKSSCDTLTTCLEEVNDFLEAYDASSNSGESAKTVGPILVRIEAKSSEEYTPSDVMDIESAVRTTIDSKYLFTPKDFGAEATQDHWSDWGNICLESMENKVVVVINSNIIDTLYPYANITAVDSDNS